MGALTHNGEVLQRLPANASQINFDKTGTNLNSTQAENAIKEVNTKVNTNTSDITQLKSGLTGKADFADMSVPPISGSAADAAGTVFDNLAITDRVVNGRYNNSGIWMFMAYKYSGDVAYGTLIAFRFDGYALFLSVNNGTKTTKFFSFNT